MNFPRILPVLLAALVLSAADDPKEDGGRLVLAGVTYHFQPTGLVSAKPKGGLGGAIRLTGDLIPESGGAAFKMEMVFLKRGQIYLLNIHRGGRGQYPDTWGATLGTRVNVIALQDRPGGRVELACSGPLTGVIARKPVSGHWEGRLRATFPERLEDASLPPNPE